MAISRTILEVKDPMVGLEIFVRSARAHERRDQALTARHQLQTAYLLRGFEAPEALLYGTSVATEEQDEGVFKLAIPKSSSLPTAATFFDQTDYMVEVAFPKNTSEARLFNPLASWCERSDWNPSSCRLLLPINFGNDLGDFDLCFEWRAEGDEHWQTISLRGQVFSTKLDIARQVPPMMQEVKMRFDWLQLDLFRSTNWNWENDASLEGDLKTWLVIFQEVHAEMTKALINLTRNHRQRLKTEERSIRAERIRKTNPRLEERISEKLQSRPDSRFSVKQQHLDADIPENRYIKHVLKQCIICLSELTERLEPIERVSRAFKERISEWEQKWSRILRQPFWQSIGNFHGLRGEILALSQDPRYASVRRNWRWLQEGLRLLDGELRGGLQNIAQLYEIWCLVELDKFICQLENWKPCEENLVTFSRDDDDFENNEEGRIGTIKLRYTYAEKYGVRLELLFQPTAGRTPNRDAWDGMMALPGRQCPDLVLRLHRTDQPGNPVFTWIFDAKYRIGSEGAPWDALDGMHRYRDAILWAGDTNGEGRLTRESIGAFVLYPGADCRMRPQGESIDRVNVGTFSLVPHSSVEAEAHSTENSCVSGHLADHLKELLRIESKHDTDPWSLREADYHYSVPHVRSHKSTTIQVATRSHMRSHEYWRHCRLYRLPDERSGDSAVPPEEWEALIPLSDEGDAYGLFPILKHQKLPRHRVEEIYEAHGTPLETSGDPESIYHLFWLSAPEPFYSMQESLPENLIARALE